METRKKWNVLRDWGDASKLNNLRELMTWKLDEVKDLLHETGKVMELEGQLLAKFVRNRALRLERSKIRSLIKITEFWMKNSIKRGEALEHLEKTLAEYDPLKEVDIKVIPELPKAFELRNQLRNLKGSFTKDDFYLTIDEMFEKQCNFYRKHMSNPSPLLRQYWEDFNAIKEKVESKTLTQGLKMIHFELPDELGRPISTKKLLEQGPLVLSFFRGTWCPYCINEMCVLTDNLPVFKAMGANLISVGADISAFRYFKKLGVIGDILFDKEMKISKQYGLVFQCTEAMVKLDQAFGFDLNQWNGGVGNFLPVPATYIIDTDGTITFSHAKIEYYKRLDPRMIVRELYKIYERKIEEDEGSVLGKRKNEEVGENFQKKVGPFEPAMKKRQVRGYDHNIDCLQKKPDL